MAIKCHGRHYNKADDDNEKTTPGGRGTQIKTIQAALVLLRRNGSHPRPYGRGTPAELE